MRLVDVAVLKQWINPFELSPWPAINDVSGMDINNLRALVEEAVQAGDVEDMSYDKLMMAMDTQCAPDADVYWHSRRIAYFVKNGFEDAITLWVGPFGRPRLEDGNHRFAAAIFMGAEQVGVDAVGSGFDVERLLGEDFFNLPEPQAAPMSAEA
jgi:hypothetical protein